jgi:hypothetical protein
VSKYVAAIPSFIDFADFEKGLVTVMRCRGEYIYLEGIKFCIKDNVVGYIAQFYVRCFEFGQLFYLKIPALSLGDPCF